MEQISLSFFRNSPTAKLVSLCGGTFLLEAPQGRASKSRRNKVISPLPPAFGSNLHLYFPCLQERREEQKEL